MDKLKRGEKVILSPKGGNKFSITDTKSNLLVDGDNDYIIYLKNVLFRRDGKIQGIFLGELKADDALLNINEYEVSFDDGVIKANKEIKTARMVTINNKKNIFVTIL